MLKQLDNDTMFTAQRFYLHTDGPLNEIRETVGVWGWDSIKSVQTVPTGMFTDIHGDKCMVEQADGYLYLRVDYQTMQKAWRTYRSRYGLQSIRFSAS